MIPYFFRKSLHIKIIYKYLTLSTCSGYFQLCPLNQTYVFPQVPSIARLSEISRSHHLDLIVRTQWKYYRLYIWSQYVCMHAVIGPCLSAFRESCKPWWCRACRATLSHDTTTQQQHTTWPPPGTREYSPGRRRVKFNDRDWYNMKYIRLHVCWVAQFLCPAYLYELWVLLDRSTYRGQQPGLIYTQFRPIRIGIDCGKTTGGCACAVLV